MEKAIILLILIVINIILYDYWNSTIIQDMREKKANKITIYSAHFLFFSPVIVVLFLLLSTLNK